MWFAMVQWLHVWGAKYLKLVWVSLAFAVVYLV